MIVTTKRGGVRAVCEVCGKDRNQMAHIWANNRWYDYCYLHWNTEIPIIRQTDLSEFGEIA